jgi:hypothetical protein
MLRNGSSRPGWMRLSTTVLSMLAVALVFSSAAGQERPDFSGVWTSPSQGGAGGMRGGGGSLGTGWGSSFTIDQDEETLTLTRVFFTRADLQPPIKYRFALDGSETRNVILMGRGMQEGVSTTAWEGDSLVITTIYDVVDDGSGERIRCDVVHTLSLEPPPAGRAAWPPSLVVETVRCGALGGPPSTTRTVFTRD